MRTLDIAPTPMSAKTDPPEQCAGLVPDESARPEPHEDAPAGPPQRLPIIAFAGLDWDALWMNRQHLLSRLAARGHPVAYSNGLAHYSDAGRLPFHQRWEFRDGVAVMKQGFYVPRSDRPSLLSRVAIRHHLRKVREALALKPGSPYVGMCFDPHMIDYVEALQPTVAAFHIYDAYHRMIGSVPDVTEVRARIRRFDLITASTRQMYEDVVGLPATAEVVLPNGVDYAAMVAGCSHASATADSIRALPGPRFGYLGSLNAKVDYALIRALAQALPTASFVIVGPIRGGPLQRSAQTQADFDALRGVPNVHFMGTVPRTEVAAVMHAMDVNCLFLTVDRSDWVPAVYPLKLNEYLAVGRPVVSSAITVVAEQFGHVVDVCGSLQEWIDALSRAAATSTDAGAERARRAVAARNDWDVRVLQLEGLLLGAARRKAGSRD